MAIPGQAGIDEFFLKLILEAANRAKLIKLSPKLGSLTGLNKSRRLWSLSKMPFTGCLRGSLRHCL